MKAIASVIAGVGLATQCFSASAATDPVPGLGGIIITGSSEFLSLPFPLAGTLGNVSLATLDLVPGFTNLNLPFIHTFAGVPVLGGITLSQGASLLGSLSFLQTPLPGLGGFGK